MDFVKVLLFCLYLFCSSYSTDHIGVSGYSSAKIEHFPSQVSIEVDGKPTCSGAIIGDQWVLTAGTCIPGNGTEVERVRIRAGSAVLTRGGAFHKVSKMKIMTPGGEGFFRTTAGNLGLIKVVSPFTYVSRIQWSAPGIDNLSDEQDIEVSGWSIRKGSSEKLLHKSKVTLIPHDQCRHYYAGILNITAEMACLVPATDNDEACIADVGAPISIRSLVTAVVSDNEYCWTKGLPLVVTNVGRFGYFIVVTLSEPLYRFGPIP